MRMVSGLGLAIAAGGLVLVAADAAGPPAASADLLSATCGDYLAAADLADPGKGASRERLRQAEAAQDALVDAMLWVHGYMSGRSAPAAPQPLTRDWMIETIRKLAESCRKNSPDGTLRLADAAMRL